MGKTKYHLRFQVIPGENAEQDARILADFCMKHGVEEAVLFFAGEEWNNGLLSRKEEDMWFDTVSAVKKILETRKISVSLNPWMTILHSERGRRFPADRKFKPTVSYEGEESKACASFSDRNWQEYIYNLYGRFAALGFRVIWIEDDFRYHGHAPLKWGGGFEDDICRKFSRKTGKNTSREEIYARILQPGKPHPWRSKWMEVWRETQLEVVKGIAEAVKKNAPGKTKLGLMSSSLPVHSIEGRRWTPMFESLTIHGHAAHRPNFAPYSEDLGKNKIFSIMKLDSQKKLRPDYVESAPEIENFPFTAWTKSDTSTWAIMALALFFGSDSLLLDLFPFAGNPADQEPRIGTLLDKSRESLDWISGRFHKKYHLYGVGIPWKENSAETVRALKGESLKELEVDTSPAWDFLLSYGVPACSDRQKVNALFGNSAWTFDDSEIMEMLKGGLLLDGAGAGILLQRGFGRHIGIEYKGLLERRTSNYSMEVITDNAAGVKKGLFFSVNALDNIPVFEPVNGAATWSDIITCEKKTVGAGIILFNNKLGGRTAVVAAENSLQFQGEKVIKKQPKNFHRQIILHNIIRYLFMGKVPFPLVSGGPYLLPMYFKTAREAYIVVLNGSFDPSPVLIETNMQIDESGQAEILKPLKKPSPLRLSRTESSKKTGLWKTSSEIPYMSFLVAGFNSHKG